MGAISEKLVYLNDTKQAIKQAINEDFEVIDDNTTFREYADEISSNNAKYKDLIPKETKNATNTLDISNSSGLDKALVTQYGNTYQETTTGKNLFDINAITEGKFYWIDQNRIVDNANWNISDYIKVNGNTNYIASYIKSTNYSQLNYSYYDENKNLLGGAGVTSDTNNYSILTPANAYYIRLGYRNNKDYILSNIQLEKGSTTTPYEEYTGGQASPNPDYPQDIHIVSGDNTIIISNSDNTQSASYPISLGDIELCKIGDYKDRIYYSSGKWYLEKKIGKVVLNGSESGWSSQQMTNNYAYQLYIGDMKPNPANSALTGYLANLLSELTPSAIWGSASNTKAFAILTDKRIRLTIGDATDKLNNFKTFLSNNNLLFYYVLATPTTTEITESNYLTLYNQLNNIKLFEGVNHITMTNESGLDVEFNIEYYKDWKLD